MRWVSCWARVRLRWVSCWARVRLRWGELPGARLESGEEHLVLGDVLEGELRLAHPIEEPSPPGAAQARAGARAWAQAGARAGARAQG